MYTQFFTQFIRLFSFSLYFICRFLDTKSNQKKQTQMTKTYDKTFNLYSISRNKYRRCCKEKSLTDGATSIQRIDLVASTNKRPHTRYLTKFCSFMAFLSAVETVLGPVEQSVCLVQRDYHCPHLEQCTRPFHKRRIHESYRPKNSLLVVSFEW